MDQEIAQRIVNAVFSELGSRGGIGDQLDLIHDDAGVYKEMHESCVEAVMSAADGEVGKFSHNWTPKGGS